MSLASSGYRHARIVGDLGCSPVLWQLFGARNWRRFGNIVPRAFALETKFLSTD